MKYIIEIEDEPFVRQSALHGEEGVYRAKGFNNLFFDKTMLDKLKPQPTVVNYIAWQENQNEIRVGDEVTVNTTKITGIVFGINKYSVTVIWVDTNDEVRCRRFITEDLQKTGRHFSEVTELIKKL